MALGYRIPSDYKNEVSKYTHNWKAPSFFTMHPGLAYVTHHRHLNTGDRLRGTVGQLVQSQPMVGPLMNGFQMITIATFTPDSIIYGWMRNGIRYTPDQWSQFDKWHITPFYGGIRPLESGDNVETAVDPSTPVGSGNISTVTAFELYPGTSYASVADTSVPVSVRNYHALFAQTYYAKGSQEAESTGIYNNALSSVGRGGLFDCMGVAPGSSVPAVLDSSGITVPKDGVSSWSFDVAPWVAYFLSSYYYLANMQEDYMYYSRGAYSLTYSDSGNPIADSSIVNLGFHQALCGFDPNIFLRYISFLGQLTQTGNHVSMDALQNFGAGIITPEDAAVFQVWILMGLQAHGGLFSVPYRPDLFNNIVKIGDAPTVTVPVQQVDGENGIFQLAIPDLRMATKWQAVKDRIFVGAGRFGDQLRTLFGTKSNPYTNKPDFLGIWSSRMDPTNTVALAAGENSQNESSTPGQMTARMDTFSNFNGKSMDYYATEPGTVMFISFIVPCPAYSQGLHPDLAVTSWADDYNPELKGAEFISVPRWRYSMLPQAFAASNIWTNGQTDSVDPNMLSVGDTVAFDWLKTDYGRLHGEFATNGYFGYWTLDRRFTEYWHKSDDNGAFTDVRVGEYYGTYVNPLSWQYVFQTQSLLDPNFFVGFNFNLKVTSSVPAGYMPYLGR